MSTPRRRDIITRLREEGYQAGLAGKHPDTCPYGTLNTDRGQWLTGWRAGDAERQQNAPVIITGHYDGCTDDYPEADKTVRQITRLDIGGGEWIDQCIDCGGVVGTGRWHSV